MKKETSSYLLLDPLQKKRRKSPRHIRPQALCERKEEKSTSYLPPDPLEKRQEEGKNLRHICPQTPLNCATFPQLQFNFASMTTIIQHLNKL